MPASTRVNNLAAEDVEFYRDHLRYVHHLRDYIGYQNLDTAENRGLVHEMKGVLLLIIHFGEQPYSDIGQLSLRQYISQWRNIRKWECPMR
ncbi:hypothetical protein CAEBREN_11862 [Caenorhabditis brenneri]|uniref:Uncharacterized protein n=1 Tax=Caenorhabditis brenneri TaxID=135651 RepID=G0MY85_CAEBE|nr:hypothetical protein CAEBREN_11862 [Caenorhabditis brenneri]